MRDFLCHQRQAFRQRGYSLLELALTIVVAGLALTVGASLFQRQVEQDRQVDNQAQVSVADEALLGFIFANGRLPCPASDPKGVEDCDLSQGYFPHRTLGMAAPLLNSAGFALRYANFLRPDTNARRDVQLTRTRDRLQPYYASDAPAIGNSQVMGSVNGLDFCQALVAGSKIAPDPGLLNISGPGGTDFTNVAYLLINPGAGDSDNDGDVLDGFNSALAPDNPRADLPMREASLAYDDQVFAAYFNQLGQALDCVSVLTPGNAHANTLSAASVMKQAMIDYHGQLELAEFLAGADVAGATGALLGSAVDTLVTTAETATSLAATLWSQGAYAGAIAAAAAAVTLSVAGVAAAVAGEAGAIATVVIATENKNDFRDLQDDLNVLHAEIFNHVRQADQAGLYE